MKVEDFFNPHRIVDRPAEWNLRKERKNLLEQKIRDREIIEEKSRQLGNLATRLEKYLSPQVHQSIFSDTREQKSWNARKDLTIFFSDIVQFTDLEPPRDELRLWQIPSGADLGPPRPCMNGSMISGV